MTRHEPEPEARLPRGGAFYDDPQVLDEYLTHRHAAVRSPNLVMEEPAFLTLAGDLAGQRILDLGCGDANFGVAALTAGCASYTGIDGSSLMVAQAKLNLADVRTEAQVSVLHRDLEDFTIDAEYDLVCSRLALHYLEDLGPVLARAHAALAPSGRFVMSVVHPTITSYDRGGDGPRTDWTVDRYFHPGPRERQWFGSAVVWHHRTIEDHVTALADAGLVLTGLSEAAPVSELFDDAIEELERRRRVPLFLVLSARR